MLKQKILTAALVAIGSFVSLEYTSLAQSNQPTTRPSPGTTQQDGTTTQPTRGTTQQDGTTTQPTQGTTQQDGTKLSNLDRQFFIQAAQGGMAEVQLGQLALKRAASNSVRQYAQQMINDHTRANKELMQLAAQKKVTLPKTVNQQQQAVMKKLSQLSGRNFDQAYMNEAGIRAHTEQAALYQRQAKQGQDPDVRAFATRTLPIVQKHLQMAQAMTGKPTGGTMNHHQAPAR